MPGVPALAIEAIDYPESDGKPIGETQDHFDETVDQVKSLEDYFRDEPDVWVAGDIFVYYRKGDPTAVVAPDVLVVRGVEKKKRKKYLLWEEKGVPPCFVVELTSKSTKDEDTGRKKQKYARLGVEELFLFDVLGEYLHPRFQGFRLMDGRYRGMRPLPDGSLHSRTLGLTLKPEGRHLRLIDAATGDVLLRIDEEREARRSAERRADEEAAQRATSELRADEEAARRAAAEKKVAEAETLGLAKGVLMLLADRGLEVEDPVRSRILGCSDPQVLRRWLVRAATAPSAEQVVQ